MKREIRTARELPVRESDRRRSGRMAAIAALLVACAFVAPRAEQLASAQEAGAAASQAAKVDAGKKLYGANCVFCHGADC